MHGPAMAGWLLVALCAGTGSYCLLRLRTGAGDQRGTAGGEALMGFGMAAMAVPAAVVTPPRWVWLLYAAVFAGAAVHALAGRRGAGPSTHHVHHILGTLAMVYMAGAMAAADGGAHGTHTAAGQPLVTAALLVYYAGYVLRAGARLLPMPAVGPEGGGTVTVGRGGRPELILACRLSMGLAMLVMLLTL